MIIFGQFFTNNIEKTENKIKEFSKVNISRKTLFKSTLFDASPLINTKNWP